MPVVTVAVKVTAPPAAEGLAEERRPTFVDCGSSVTATTSSRSSYRRERPGDARVARSHRPAGIEAPLGEPDQFSLSAAGIEPGERAVDAAVGRFTQDLQSAPDIDRLPRKDLTEDRSEGEDVGRLAQALDLAPRLLGAHVRRGAYDCPRL